MDNWAAHCFDLLFVTASTDFLFAFFGALSESGMKKSGVRQILADDSEWDAPTSDYVSFFYPHFQKVFQKSEWAQTGHFPT